MTFKPFVYNPVRKSFLVERTYTHVSDGCADFGLRDQRGRAIGYAYAIQHVNVRPVGPDEKGFYGSHYEGDPLEYYEAGAGVTRDGRSFGASHPRLRATSLTEVKALIAKRMEGSQRKYTKQYGGQS